MMVVGWVAEPRPDTHRTLISVGVVGSWSDGWGSLAWEWEVSGLLLLSAGGVWALCLHLLCLFQTYACQALQCSAIRDGCGHC